MTMLKRTTDQTGRRGGVIVKTVIVLAVLGALGGGTALVMSGGEGDGAVETGATFEVQRGPLTISVSEAGTLRAREQEVISSEVEGRNEIIYIIAEGSMVEAGDLLIELDSSGLNDEKVEEEIQVQNAEAAYIRARENLAVAESQAKSDIAQAELDHRFAIEDKTRYIDGEFPKERKELESRITLAKEELERAEDRLEGSERLFEAKYIAESELEGDRLSRNRALLDYELAVANLDLLDQYTYPRRIDELDSSIEQTQLALDRVKRKASADVVQAQANLRAAEVEFERQKSQLADIIDQLGKTKMYAPTSGMAIYATSVDRGGRWDNDQPLQEGYEVRERENLIYLPTASSMMAELSIHESALEKAEVGQAVRVTVPAVPGRVFRGRVAKIAPLPDQSSWWNPDLRVYATEIHLEDELTGVRTGMSCRAEIIVAEYDDALYVPIQAITRSGGRPVAYVQDATGTLTKREVKIGLDNNRMVHVLEGLQEGELVALAPPLEPSGGANRPSGRPGGQGRPGQGQSGGGTSAAKPAATKGSTTAKADDTAVKDAETSDASVQSADSAATDAGTTANTETPRREPTQAAKGP
jgi:HlyD family secretion protein